MDKNNPIHYSDLITPDSAITDLIKQLEDLNSKYAETIEGMKKEASEMTTSLRNLSGATEQGRTAITEMAKKAEELAEKQKKVTNEQEMTTRELARLRIAKAEAMRIAKLEEKLAQSEAGSYNALSAQYSLNKIRLNALTEEYRKNNAEGQKLEKETFEIYQKMKMLQEATGKHTLNVGNYTSAWNGLYISVLQIGRELPSLAVSANTFFLAISNNLPMLVDEINKIKEANAIAAREGGQQVSVWKELAKSVFSWNTAITLAITALTLFGGKIVEFVKNLIQSKDAMNANAEAMKTMNDVMRKGAENAQNEIVKLRLLISIATDASRTMAERNKAVDELQKRYPHYLGNMEREKILAGDIQKELANLTSEILKNARARVAEEKILENMRKRIALEEQLADAKKKARETEERENKRAKEINATAGEAAKVGTKRAKDRVEEIVREIAAIDELNKKLEKLATVTGVTGAGTDTKTKEPKAPKTKADTTAEDEAKKTLELRRKLEDATVKYEISIYEQRREEIKLSYNRQIEDLKIRLEQEKNLTVEQQELIYKTIIELRKREANEIAKVNADEQVNILELEKKTIDLRLAVARKGSEEENKLRLQQIETERQIALAKNATLSEGYEDEADINAKYDAMMLAERKRYADEVVKTQMDIFDQMQEYKQSEFELLKSTETEKTKYRLEQEKARLQKILELNKIAGTKLSELQIQQIKNTIAKIDQELGNAGRGKKDIYDLTGLKLDDEEKQAIDTSVSYAMDNLNAYMQAELEAANQAVSIAEKKVESAQKALDAEREARANGYANNVEMAQKELDNAKKNQEKALAEQRKAQRAQQAIQTVTQASNLVSASALIWAQLGFPWAIPALAVMWGSFAAAKIKAAQVTKNTETYGEGTVELLQGGSHQSGNDISLGTKADGTERRAEGGEFFAVINKRNSRRFRKEIPSVINSLNNGTFANKYLQAYNGTDDVMNLNVNGNGTDITELNENVRQIREQNERNVYTTDGMTIIRYKNLKQTIR